MQVRNLPEQLSSGYSQAEWRLIWDQKVGCSTHPIQTNKMDRGDEKGKRCSLLNTCGPHHAKLTRMVLVGAISLRVVLNERELLGVNEWKISTIQR